MASRRERHIAFWRIVNPPTRPLAGIVPWWVLLETTGRRTGRPHRVPLAAGPRDGESMWLAAVHGRQAAWVQNIAHDGHVRLRVRRRWHDAVAEIHDFTPEVAARFNRYARGGPALLGMDPKLVLVRWGST